MWIGILSLLLLFKRIEPDLYILFTCYCNKFSAFSQIRVGQQGAHFSRVDVDLHG